MRRFVSFTIFVIFLGLSAACSDNSAPPPNTAQSAPENTSQTAASSPEATINDVTADNTPSGSNSCSNLKRKGFALDKKQTFLIDFAPFEKSCFATFHDPEFINPPLGAQYYIYKDGKEVFAFPEQFNSGNATCWVDAVSFEDVNGDQLKDIIVIGKCGAKSEAYNENMVYINNGKDFNVNKAANMEMMDFSKISEVQKYIRENQKDFSK